MRADPTARGLLHVVELPGRDAPRVDVHELAASWRCAFDAAGSALQAAEGYVPRAELTARRRELVAERTETLRLLRAVAREHGRDLGDLPERGFAS